MLRPFDWDELRLVVAPAGVGRRRRLFGDGVVLDRLEVRDLQRSAQSTVFLVYGIGS
jgi:hypothetical protein